MIKWEFKNKILKSNGIYIKISFFEIYKWNGEKLFSLRCCNDKNYIELIKKILTDINYCYHPKIDLMEFKGIEGLENYIYFLEDLIKLVLKEAIH